MKNSFAEPFVAVFNHRCEFRQRHQLVRFNQVFFFPSPRDAGAASAAGIRFLPDDFLADEIGRRFRTAAISRFENNSISEVQRRHIRFIPAAKGRQKGSFGLCRHHCRCPRLAQNIDVAIRFGDETLSFVLPADQKVVFL